MGGARSSEREIRLIDTVAEALVAEEKLTNPPKVMKKKACSLLHVACGFGGKKPFCVISPGRKGVKMALL